ncbi:uncharacterized protein LY89DRAFT_680961 [Mollisia scopiformis]|uniref:Uncharacterized protein n=1 Tax=Mollisia scopiformis TaxID=149040 RepID=A0A194XRG3_MOLSC|nr:uncharacterized protein LY89DRAFT_680961 [Mollisia scopiformis]KUJ22880.1 hypothetical protein LY89DRAFT_680961 [Mollisia scopiformis]
MSSYFSASPVAVGVVAISFIHHRLMCPAWFIRPASAASSCSCSCSCSCVWCLRTANRNSSRAIGRVCDVLSHTRPKIITVTTYLSYFPSPIRFMHAVQAFVCPHVQCWKPTDDRCNSHAGPSRSFKYHFMLCFNSLTGKLQAKSLTEPRLTPGDRVFLVCQCGRLQ